MRKPLLVRLTPETRKALALLAQRDDRSMASMVEMLVKREAIRQGVYSPAIPVAVGQKETPPRRG